MPPTYVTPTLMQPIDTDLYARLGQVQPTGATWTGDDIYTWRCTEQEPAIGWPPYTTTVLYESWDYPDAAYGYALAVVPEP